jgi:hypothetical protein
MRFGHDSSTAVPPRAEQYGQISTIHEPIVVEVTNTGPSPVAKQDPKICAVHYAIMIEVCWARGDTGHSPFSNAERSGSKAR